MTLHILSFYEKPNAEQKLRNLVRFKSKKLKAGSQIIGKRMNKILTCVFTVFIGLLIYKVVVRSDEHISVNMPELVKVCFTSVVPDRSK